VAESCPILLSRMTVATPVCGKGLNGEAIMTSVNPNYYIHAANVLLLVAYIVRDILWLRRTPELWQRRRFFRCRS
jgi:hypothetical protein